METLPHDRRAAACARAPARGARRSGLVPTMGALHDGHVALFGAARRRVRRRRREPVRQPGAVRRARRPRGLPARSRPRRSASPPSAGVDLLFAPAADELYPAGFATWVEPEGAADGLEGEHRPGHFRGVATVCLKLFNDRPPGRRLLRPQGRPAGRGRQAARARPRTSSSRSGSSPTVRDADGLALSSRNARLSRRRARARARDPACARDARPRNARAPSSPRRASSPTTSPSPTSTGRRSPSPPGSARPA